MFTTNCFINTYGSDRVYFHVLTCCAAEQAQNSCVMHGENRPVCTEPNQCFCIYTRSLAPSSTTSHSHTGRQVLLALIAS